MVNFWIPEDIKWSLKFIFIPTERVNIMKRRKEKNKQFMILKLIQIFVAKAEETNFYNQGTLEVTYFTQHIGKVLKDHDNFLNFIVYVEALLHEAQIKQNADQKKLASLTSEHYITLQNSVRYSIVFWVSTQILLIF